MLTHRFLRDLAHPAAVVRACGVGIRLAPGTTAGYGLRRDVDAPPFPNPTPPSASWDLEYRRYVDEQAPARLAQFA